MYCHSAPIFLDLKNYIPVSLSLATLFSDGTYSPVADIIQPFYMGGMLFTVPFSF